MSEVLTPEVSTETPATEKATPRPKAKKSPKPKAKAKAKPSGNGQTGNVVGYLAKCKQDVKWTDLKVAFYKALRKCGGAGTSEKIAKASGGKINAGNARHFGYHGVGSGLTRVDQHEDQRGFVFALTAKGKNIDPESELRKQQAKK